MSLFSPKPVNHLTPLLLGVLSFLAAVGPFATDMYLASFTHISRDLGASASAVQLTLTAFLLGMGLGQLLLGPLSDQFGRRPMLLGGMVMFAMSSVAMVFSPNVQVFIALRALQGLSGAAGVVVSRAIAVDIAKGAEAVKAISLIAMFVGLGPLLAPPVGGAVLGLGDWRAVLAVLAILSLLMLLATATIVPESLPRAERRAGGLRDAFASFGSLLHSGSFVVLLLVFGAGFGAMMAYISASPFVAQKVLGMSELAYSLAFSLGAAALVLANLLNARVAGRIAAHYMLLTGTVLVLLPGLLLTAASYGGWLSIPLFISFAFFLSGGTGLIMANASALALRIADKARGAGSALLGALQFLIGGAASPLVGAWGEHTALPMALFVAFAGLLTTVAAVGYVVRHGRS